MIFTSEIIKAIANSSNHSSLLWSSIYDNWFNSANLSTEITNSFTQWEDLKSPADFAKLLHNHPEYGYIILDGRYRPRVLHAVTKSLENSFMGVLLDN
jgi:hypothetical protein